MHQNCVGRLASLRKGKYVKTAIFIAFALISFGAQAQPKPVATIPCDDSMIYQNPFVYGGQQPRACAVIGLSPRVNARNRVLGRAKYGVCDYEILSRRATKDAWEKCGNPVRGVVRISDWQFECLDHTYGSDSGSTAVATFACL